MSNKEQLEAAYFKYKHDYRMRDFWVTSNFVPGEGPIPASVMLAGEAPGRAEDAQRRPFVGEAGKVLDKLLLRAELRREDVFITNTVKFRPVDENGRNRTPSMTEVENSLECLKREIELVNPQVIGLMGRVAIQAFFGSFTPGQWHGKTYRKTPTSRPVVFLYHPAFAVYSKKMLQTLIDDFQAIPAALADIAKENSGGDESTDSRQL